LKYEEYITHLPASERTLAQQIHPAKTTAMNAIECFIFKPLPAHFRELKLNYGAGFWIGETGRVCFPPQPRL